MTREKEQLEYEARQEPKASPRKPEVEVPELDTVVTHYRRQIAQEEHELTLIKDIKEMKRVRQAMVARLNLHKRCLAVAEAGYAEVKPPQTWRQGFLHAPYGRERRPFNFLRSRRMQAKGDFFVFHRGMPARVVAEYERAKATGLFDFYTVHSPDQSDFLVADHVETLAERAEKLKVSISEYLDKFARSLDPLLVGWVNAEVLIYRGNYEQIVVANKDAGNTHSFLIGMWDTVKDLAYDLPMLEAPKSQ